MHSYLNSDEHPDLFNSPDVIHELHVGLVPPAMYLIHGDDEAFILFADNAITCTHCRTDITRAYHHLFERNTP